MIYVHVLLDTLKNTNCMMMEMSEPPVWELYHVESMLSLVYCTVFMVCAFIHNTYGTCTTHAIYPELSVVCLEMLRQGKMFPVEE